MDHGNYVEYFAKNKHSLEREAVTITVGRKITKQTVSNVYACLISNFFIFDILMIDIHTDLLLSCGLLCEGFINISDLIFLSQLEHCHVCHYSKFLKFFLNFFKKGLMMDKRFIIAIIDNVFGI